MITIFFEVWVPDDELKLSGKLSEVTFPVKRIGILSRLKRFQVDQPYELTVLLSGPEPQRTALEEIILKQVYGGTRRIVVVRGVIEVETVWNQVGHVSVVNFLQAKELEEILNRSALVIARSGYSTIMDLVCLGKKAVFIPTPGQTEQEYLAQQLMRKKICYSMRQDEFNLESAIEQSKEYIGFSNIEATNSLLAKVIDQTLQR
jgi:UDP:flavonoid glycosyltransferase YjiC (YdhE family)